MWKYKIKKLNLIFYLNEYFNVTENQRILFFPSLSPFITSNHQGTFRNATAILAYIPSSLDTPEYIENEKIMCYLERLKWKNLLFVGSHWNVASCVIVITEPAKIAHEFSNGFLLSKGTFPWNYLCRLEELSALQKELWMAIKYAVTLPKFRAIRIIFKVLKDCSNLLLSFAKIRWNQANEQLGGE